MRKARHLAKVGPGCRGPAGAWDSAIYHSEPKYFSILTTGSATPEFTSQLLVLKWQEGWARQPHWIGPFPLETHFVPLPKQPLTVRLDSSHSMLQWNHLPPVKEGIVFHLGRPQLGG